MTNAATIALVGPMAVGKSHIARELARLSHWPHCDLDKEIERRIETSIAAFFASHGEAEFRQIESEILREVLERGGIIATGGGIVTQEINRDSLRQVFTVYLRAQPETLARRIRLQPGTRPLIDGDGALDFSRTLLRVREILDARAAWYDEVASFIIDTDESDPRHTAHEIWAQYQQWQPFFSTEL